MPEDFRTCDFKAWLCEQNCQLLQVMLYLSTEQQCEVGAGSALPVVALACLHLESVNLTRKYITMSPESVITGLVRQVVCM